MTRLRRILSIALLVMFPLLAVCGATQAEAKVTVTLTLSDLSSVSARFTSADPSTYTPVTMTPPDTSVLPNYDTCNTFTASSTSFKNSTPFYAWVHLIGKESVNVSITGSQLKGTSNHSAVPYSFSVGESSKQVTAAKAETLTLDPIVSTEFSKFWYAEVKLDIPTASLTDTVYSGTLTMNVSIV